MKKAWQLYKDLCTMEVQIHHSVQHGEHVGQLLWTNIAYHGHVYVEAF